MLLPNIKSKCGPYSLNLLLKSDRQIKFKYTWVNPERVFQIHSVLSQKLCMNESTKVCTVFSVLKKGTKYSALFIQLHARRMIPCNLGYFTKAFSNSGILFEESSKLERGVSRAGVMRSINIKVTDRIRGDCGRVGVVHLMRDRGNVYGKIKVWKGLVTVRR